jgi:hypothetical protein
VEQRAGQDADSLTSIVTDMSSSERLERIRASVRTPAQLTVVVIALYGALFAGIAAEQVSDTPIRRFGAVGRSLSDRFPTFLKVPPRGQS